MRESVNEAASPPFSSIATISIPPQSTSTIAPLPSSTAQVPRATCTAVGRIDKTVVGIWTNYVTDTGDALEKAEKKSCRAKDWSITYAPRDWTAPDGTKWTSNYYFEFSVEVRRPAELMCIRRGIIDAGGPSDTANCPFKPFGNP